MTPYYDQDGVTIYQGDNREVMPTLDDGSVDLVLTSPPYNLGNSGGNRGGFFAHARRLGHYSADAGMAGRGGNGRWKAAKQPGSLAHGYGAHDDAMPHEEYAAWQKAFLLDCWRVLSPVGAIYYNHKCRVLDGLLVTPLDYNPGLPVRQIVTWDRGGGVNCAVTHYCPSQEWLVIFAHEGFRLRDKSASAVGDVWRITPEIRTPHPAPFPLALAVRAIETTKPGVVLDPFAGWGTTLVAAKLLGRPAIGIELEERFCEMAAKRLCQQVLPLADAATTSPGLFEVTR